eukprot:Skav205696  [mRNA]  locus=scaffold3495:52669:54395:- [translate_table: standard]
MVADEFHWGPWARISGTGGQMEQLSSTAEACFAGLFGLATNVLALIHPHAPEQHSKETPLQNAQAIVEETWEDYIVWKRKQADADLPVHSCSPSSITDTSDSTVQDAKAIMEETWEDYIVWKRKQADADLPVHSCSPSSITDTSDSTVQDAKAIMEETWEDYIVWKRKQADADLPVHSCSPSSITDTSDLTVQDAKAIMEETWEDYIVWKRKQADADLPVHSCSPSSITDTSDLTVQDAKAIMEETWEDYIVWKRKEGDAHHPVQSCSPTSIKTSDSMAPLRDQLQVGQRGKFGLLLLKMIMGGAEAKTKAELGQQLLREALCFRQAAKTKAELGQQLLREALCFRQAVFLDAADAASAEAVQTPPSTRKGSLSEASTSPRSPEEDDSESEEFTFSEFLSQSEGGEDFTLSESEGELCPEDAAPPPKVPMRKKASSSDWRPPLLPRQEQRVDPEDGLPYTWDEMWDYYKDIYDKAEVEAYWDECKPQGSASEPKMRRLQERLSFAEARI